MTDVVLDSVEVMSFLPKQNANAVFQNMIVPFCRMNAGEGRISLDDDIHVLAGPRPSISKRIEHRGNM